MKNKMKEKRTWKEFRETGLLLFINQILHVFGWAIIVDEYKNTCYPARVLFRGFEEKKVEESYIKITKYMKENSEQLLKEISDETS